MLPEAATRGVLLKEAVLKNFVILTGKYMRWSIFLKRYLVVT